MLVMTRPVYDRTVQTGWSMTSLVPNRGLPRPELGSLARLTPKPNEPAGLTRYLFDPTGFKYYGVRTHTYEREREREM